MIRTLLAALLLVASSLAQADYVTTILADSPCALWKMNETSGVTFTNTGSSNTGGGDLNATVVGAPTLNQPGGVAGYNSVQWNGSTQWADWSWGSGGAAGSCKGFASGAGTVECWVNPTDTASDTIIESAGAAAGRTFELDKGDGGKAVNFYVYDGAGFDGVLGTTNVPTSTWYFAAGTYSDSANQITANYNGVTEATATTTKTATASIGGYIAAHLGAASFLTGSVQMCAIYTTKLSDSTLAAHRAAGVAVPSGGAGMPMTVMRDRLLRPAGFGPALPDALRVNAPNFVVEQMNRSFRWRGQYARDAR